MENVIDATESTFDGLSSQPDKIILVDFWAEWCGPCRMLGSALHEVAQELGDKVLILKVDVDTNSELPLKYAVRSIPAVFIFKNGTQIGKFVGARTKNEIIALISPNL
jgi:thioredoxin 1